MERSFSSWIRSDRCRYASTVVHLIFVSFVGELSAKVYATQVSPNVYETQFGRVRGLMVAAPNRTLPPVEVFLGLQYASLLGGGLRFMPPTSSIEKWESTRVAIKFRPVCPQKLSNLDREFGRMPVGRVEHLKRIIRFVEKQDEDCLHLNLYVPFRGNTVQASPVA